MAEQVGKDEVPNWKLLKPKEETVSLEGLPALRPMRTSISESLKLRAHALA
ncbi:MAG: hypothetical protein ACJAT2_002948 [Bacteriovoracaceae bacterium]|jgi:hypothetical protein